MTPVDQFSALADPTRCRVIEMLHQRPMPVHELSSAFDISRPAISRHLRVLKEAQLVKEEKQGRENVYSLQRQRLKPLSQWLDKLGPKPQVKSARKVAAIAPAVEQPKPMPVAKPAKVARPLPVPPAPKAQMQLDLF